MTSLLVNIGSFFIANVLARLLGAARSFWLAGILAPADFGIWIFVLLLSSYAPILSLGAVETLVKKVPFFRGSGDLQSAEEIEKGSFTFMLLVAAVLCACAVLVPGLLPIRLARYALPVRLMTIAVALSMVSAFYFYRLEAHNRFDRAGAVTTARSVLTLVLQVALGSLYGLPGAVFGYLASELLVLACSAMLNRGLSTTLGLRFTPSLAASLIRTGFPITIVWWTYILQTTLDRVVSMALLGETATGYYGIGMSFAAAYLLLPDAINQVLYPAANEQYGRTRAAQELESLVVAPSRALAVVLPLFTGLFILALPPAMRALVPGYLPGLHAAQVLIAAALFSGLARGGANLLVSTDRQGVLLLHGAVAIVINLAGNLAAVKLGAGITGIAAATAVSAAWFAMAVWVSVFTTTGYSLGQGIAAVLVMFAPASFLVLVSLVVPSVLSGSLRLQGAGLVIAEVLALAAYAVLIAVIPLYRATVGQAALWLQSALSSRRAGAKGPSREGRHA